MSKVKYFLILCFFSFISCGYDIKEKNNNISIHDWTYCYPNYGMYFHIKNWNESKELFIMINSFRVTGIYDLLNNKSVREKMVSIDESLQKKIRSQDNSSIFTLYFGEDVIPSFSVFEDNFEGFISDNVKISYELDRFDISRRRILDCKFHTTSDYYTNFKLTKKNNNFVVINYDYLTSKLIQEFINSAKRHLIKSNLKNNNYCLLNKKLGVVEVIIRFDKSRMSEKYILDDGKLERVVSAPSFYLEIF